MTVNSIYTTDTFRSMFDALPSPVFVVDGDVMVHDYPTGNGPQGDAIRIYNYVRLVRDADN